MYEIAMLWHFSKLIMFALERVMDYAVISNGLRRMLLEVNVLLVDAGE